MSKRVLKVKVISKAGDKTVVGLHEFLVKHPIYGKYLKKRKKYMIHDENNTANVGDEISIMESRPLSRRKSWVIVNNNEVAEEK